MRILPALLSVLLLAACDHGGGGPSHDFGNNDPNVVACVGDSLTQGVNCIGAPYPTRLAAMSGKRVLNFGRHGTVASEGASTIASALARHPGYVCILFGSNDAIHGVDYETTRQNIRRIVVACKNNQSVPLLATPPPMIGGHELYAGHADRVAEVIREIATEQGVTLVDLHAAFGSDPSPYLNPDDGLHLSEAGGDLVAKKFNAAF